MVTICLQCGDEGWDNALVYCIKCLNEAVHRYCLDVIPKTFDEFVPWVCDVCEEEPQKSSHSNSDARTQGKTCSGKIEVDSTITLNKKRIRHLPKRVENGHSRNKAGLRSTHKELDSSKDAKTPRKRSSEQIEVDSAITPKKKRISHSTESSENGHSRNKAGLRSPHKELDSSKDAKTQGKRSSEQIEVDSSITPKKKRISQSTESSENGHCKNGAGLQSLYEELDLSEVPKTQGKTCSEQIEVDSTVTPNKKRIRHSIESLENGHCKNGSGLQSPPEELDLSEDHKTQGKACSEKIEDDSTITLEKTRISHLAERVENGIRLQSSHKEPDSSKGAELVSQYRPSRVGTKSINDCSHMVLIDNEQRSPIKSSPLQKAKEVEVLSNGPFRKAKLRKLNDSSLLVTTNQSESLESAKSDEDFPLASVSQLATEPEKDISCSLDNFAEQRCESVSALQPHKQEQDNYYEKKVEPIEELNVVNCDKNDANNNSQSPMKAESTVAAGEKCLWAKPLMDPIWRGNFYILNQDDVAECDVQELAAHLSSKACRMVYNEASLLPTSLQFKILPKAALWPKSFENSDPTDDNIAMYIFPIDPRYSNSFDLLVDKMNVQELALKATTRNAELLIFTSSELPLSYWTFRGKTYLWGVFRGKPSLLSSLTAGDRVVPT